MSTKRLPVVIDADSGALHDATPINVEGVPMMKPIGELPLLVGLGILAGYYFGKSDMLENLLGDDEEDGEDDDG